MKYTRIIFRLWLVNNTSKYGQWLTPPHHPRLCQSATSPSLVPLLAPVMEQENITEVLQYRTVTGHILHWMLVGGREREKGSAAQYWTFSRSSCASIVSSQTNVLHEYFSTHFTFYVAVEIRIVVNIRTVSDKITDLFKTSWNTRSLSIVSSPALLSLIITDGEEFFSIILGDPKSAMFDVCVSLMLESVWGDWSGVSCLLLETDRLFEICMIETLMCFFKLINV